VEYRPRRWYICDMFPASSANPVVNEIKGLVRDTIAALFNQSDFPALRLSLVGGGIIHSPDVSYTGTLKLISGQESHNSLLQYSQIWCIFASTFQTILDGQKVRQRELWYKLKTTGLFTSPSTLNQRILDACSVIAYRGDMLCERVAYLADCIRSRRVKISIQVLAKP